MIKFSKFQILLPLILISQPIAAEEDIYPAINQRLLTQHVLPQVDALKNAVSTVADRVLPDCPGALPDLAHTLQVLENQWAQHGFILSLAPIRYTTPPHQIYLANVSAQRIEEDLRQALTQQTLDKLPARSHGLQALRVAMTFSEPDNCRVISALTEQMLANIDKAQQLIDSGKVHKELLKPDGHGEFFDAYEVSSAIGNQFLNHWNALVESDNCQVIPGLARQFAHYYQAVDGDLKHLSHAEHRQQTSVLDELKRIAEQPACQEDWRETAQASTEKALTQLSSLRLGIGFNARDGD